MAFNTPTGNYEDLVMALSLTNAPTVFQALGNDVLWDMLNIFVFVYLDDILIFFPPDLQTHQLHTSQVLNVSILRYVIVEGEVRIDPEKVLEWRTPQSRKEEAHLELQFDHCASAST